MKTICFVKYDAGVRIYKQAKALKEINQYKLLLICEKCDYDLLKDVFDEVIFFGFLKSKNNNPLSRSCNYASNKMFKFDEKKLKRIVNSINIDVDIFHTHAEPNNIPRIVIENSTKPVVFDEQDFTGISSGIEKLDTKTKEDEKYCFEHADGIVRKGPPFEIDYYRQHGYKIDCPEIQWLDYCDESLFADTNTTKLSDEDGELHLVYTGTISPNKKNLYKYFIPLGGELAKQNIHLHIYPASLEFEYLISKEYMELDRKEKYFHFHKPIPYEKLGVEIAKYDWGVVDASIVLPVNFEGVRLTKERKRTAIGNKAFGYMEAGIPVIVSRMYTAYKDIIEKNQIGFSMDKDELNKLGKILKEHDYQKLKENVRNVRKILSLSKQIKYLDMFYQRVFDNFT